jgi:hypothetical protein
MCMQHKTFNMLLVITSALLWLWDLTHILFDHVCEYCPYMFIYAIRTLETLF